MFFDYIIVKNDLRINTVREKNMDRSASGES